eukprot:TRINITY_DN908_c0_g1_i1.p1 TRINITY_DN908_c0_g1~~TRINITY_DN908_c0_g1_i1.p1  ORF type:complete len:611 (+),score=71.90 TRINITY_DN908_c0_g1_i1:352-2184(+)
MLVRKRRPDPSLHVVLWQVGLIGELGFRRLGCLNSRFHVLLDYLERFYDADQQVINYVASRYPGIDAVREKHTLRSLREPHAQSKVTGISTFYLPPVETAQCDEQMLLELGLIEPGQSVHAPTSVLRRIDLYGRRERKAFEDFARFKVPMDYHWQSDTASARFILALREDTELRANYQTDACVAVRSWGGELSTVDVRRLATRDAGAMQIAAKGVRTRVAPECAALIRDLLTKEPLCKSLLRAARHGGERREQVNKWMIEHGQSVNLDELQEDLQITLRQELYPWTGCYLAKEKKLSVVVHGLPGTGHANRVYVNGERIQGVCFHNGHLYWRGKGENDTNDSLRVDVTPRGARRLVGNVCGAREQLGSKHRVVALELSLDWQLPLALFCGSYRVEASDLSVEPSRENGATMAVYDGKERIDKGAVGVNATGLHLNGLSIPFSTAQAEHKVPTFARGEYRVRLVRKGKVGKLQTWWLSDSTLRVNEEEVALEAGGKRMWSWSDARGEQKQRAKVCIVMDPISLTPMLFGETTGGVLIRGMRCIRGDVVETRAATMDLSVTHSWAWRHLVHITARSSETGGLFLWHGWKRSVNNMRRLRAVLQLVHEGVCNE